MRTVSRQPLPQPVHRAVGAHPASAWAGHLTSGLHPLPTFPCSVSALDLLFKCSVFFDCCLHDPIATLLSHKLLSEEQVSRITVSLNKCSQFCHRFVIIGL